MRLTRVTNKIFGETADIIGSEETGAEIGQFGSAKAGTYNATGDVATIQGLDAWKKGWIEGVIPNMQYPTLPEMTGVHKVLSYQTGYLMQEGIAEYDSETNYCTGSWVKAQDDNGVYSIYESLVDDNKGNALTDVSKWQKRPFGGAGSDLNKFSINNGKITDGIEDVLQQPQIGIIEQIGGVEGVGNTGNVAVTRTFESPKTLKNITAHLSIYPIYGGAIDIGVILTDDTTLRVAQQIVYLSSYNQQITYTFETPTVVKAITINTNLDKGGSVACNNINFVEQITISEADTLYFNVSNENPITYTNAQGETYTKNYLNPIDVSDKADGIYNVMLNSTNQPYLHSGSIYYKKGEPTSMNEGDIWFNKVTQKAYKYTDNELVEIADVPCGKVTVASDVISQVLQPIYNVDFQKTYIIKSYVNGTDGYDIYSPDDNGNMKCVQYGLYQPTQAGSYTTTISLLKKYENTSFIVFRESNSNNGNTSASSNYFDEGCSSKTTSSFTMIVQGNSLSGQYAWETKGIIDRNEIGV